MPKESKGRLFCSHEDINDRLDVFVQKKFPDMSRSKLQELIKKNLVFLNNKKAKPSAKLQENDIIDYDFTNLKKQTEIYQIKQTDTPIEIIFEDSEILVVNKPAGMITHPGIGNTEDSLVHALYSKLLKNDPVRPGVVHRLDKDTSGLLVLAKTYEALTSLKRQFKDKTAKRVYWALHFGKTKVLSGQWSTHLSRSSKNRLKFSSQENGKLAITNFKSLIQGPVSLTELALETGRTHQIRVHLSENQLPILNDALYGSVKNINSINDIKLKSKLKKIKHMALVARKLSFKHPASQEILNFEVPWPKEFEVYENI